MGVGVCSWQGTSLGGCLGRFLVPGNSAEIRSFFVYAFISNVPQSAALRVILIPGPNHLDPLLLLLLLLTILLCSYMYV